jgi:large subunit ribosomal protein L10
MRGKEEWSLNRTEKEQVVERFRGKFSDAKIGILTGYRGMTVSEMTELRSQLRKESVEYRVIKNNLAKIASEGTSLEPLKEHFNGPTAIALSYDDVVAPARVLNNAAKSFKKLEILAGSMDGNLLSQDEIMRIATLPSRDELLGMFLRVLQAPVTNFATVLTAPLRDLVGVLNAVKDQKAA